MRFPVRSRRWQLSEPWIQRSPFEQLVIVVVGQRLVRRVLQLLLRQRLRCLINLHAALPCHTTDNLRTSAVTLLRSCLERVHSIIKIGRNK
jgi:hypothetical protein